MANRKANSKTGKGPNPELVTRSFVVTRNQDQALKALAERNHRSYSGEIRRLIEIHLEAEAA